MHMLAYENCFNKCTRAYMINKMHMLAYEYCLNNVCTRIVAPKGKAINNTQRNYVSMSLMCSYSRQISVFENVVHQVDNLDELHLA